MLFKLRFKFILGNALKNLNTRIENNSRYM